MDSKELFLKTRPLKLFFIAAIPGAISMLASALYGLFDGIFVGQILGDTAFAAINLAFPFVIINFALSDLVAVGSAVPISISLGRREEKEANNIFTCALLMIVGAGSFMGLLLFFGSPYIIGFMGASEEASRLAVQYIRVYAVFSPVITSVFAFDNYLRISGKVKFSMWINVVMSIATAVTEFIFLFAFRFDIWGAALASCLCLTGGALTAFVPFAIGKFQLKLTRPHFSAKTAKQIIKCGMPIFLNNISGRVTSIAMNKALISMGGDPAVAIYGILMYVGEIIQPLIYGICDSLQPAIGYNWGAKRYDRVKSLSKCTFAAGAVVSVVSFVMMWTIPELLVSLFTKSTDTAFLSEAVEALKIYAFSRLIFWFSFATQSYMTAVEKPLYATFISVGSAFVFPMALIFALRSLGLFGLWLNSPITMVLTTLLSVVIMLLFSKELKRREAEASI
ncbi:MAG: MATE family efflux transporter [Eubacteriales bacterium]